jgi:flagellar hook-basal body complex protein FliE
MDVRAALASQSYALARTAAAPDRRPAGSGSEGFAQLAGNLADTLQKGETAARNAMTGGADPHALVEALAASQTAIETAVTVRDRVVEAYQEILRMPV